MCVGNRATLFLMVGGSVTIFGSAMKVVAWLASPPRLHGKVDLIANLSDFAFFVIAIWGSVEVFGGFKIAVSVFVCYFILENVENMNLEPIFRVGLNAT